MKEVKGMGCGGLSNTFTTEHVQPRQGKLWNYDLYPPNKKGWYIATIPLFICALPRLSPHLPRRAPCFSRVVPFTRTSVDVVVLVSPARWYRPTVFSPSPSGFFVEDTSSRSFELRFDYNINREKNQILEASRFWFR